MKKLFLTILLIQILFSVYSSSYSDVSQQRLVRFSLWAQTDVYPGYFDSDEVSEKEKALNQEKNNKVTLSVPIQKIKEIAPFILSGMLYGWKFEYTPYDKTRGVEEFFEFLPVKELSESEIKTINYAKPWIENDKLSAWIEYWRSENQIHSYLAWNSIQHPRIKGIGYAKLSEGFDGIKKATEDSIKNAVREYERTQLKTKPKEVSGVVFLCEPPLIGIDSGRYKITLDLLMETKRIIQYKNF